jgi:hypothetical protein
MYTKYTCPPARTPRMVNLRPCFIKPSPSQIDNTQPGAIPESVRISSWPCSTAIVFSPNTVVANTSSFVCIGPTKIEVPVPVGSPAPIVNIQTVPASVTLRQRVATILDNESNPYNPNTRFAAYFPPAPIPYECPERIPNNLPRPSAADCLPIRRFQGSAAAAGLES